MSMKTLAVIPQLCCGPDVPPLAPAAAERLAARFRALADPTRVAIVNRLAQAEETCVCDLTVAFDLSQPTNSHHTKVLRQAFDADHIAAIDNTTRKLLQEKQRPLGVGFFFSLGHSSIVFVLAAALAVGTHAVDSRLPSFQHYGSFVGASISGTFLWLIGI